MKTREIQHLYMGDVVRFYVKRCYIPGIHHFMLANTAYGSKLKFVCVKGPHLKGYIEFEIDTDVEGAVAVTKDHLIRTITEEMGDFKIKTFKIIGSRWKQ